MLLRVLTLPPPGHIYHRAKIRPSLGTATVAADVTPTTIGDLIHRGGRQTANPVGNVASQPPEVGDKQQIRLETSLHSRPRWATNSKSGWKRRFTAARSSRPRYSHGRPDRPSNVILSVAKNLGLLADKALIFKNKPYSKFSGSALRKYGNITTSNS